MCATGSIGHFVGLQQRARGSLHQIVMSRVPSRPGGSSGLQFQPAQHFLDNNQCNACRNIQLSALRRPTFNGK